MRARRIGGIEGFGQVIVGAEFDAFRNLVRVGVGADHDNGDVSRVRTAFDNAQHLVSVEVGHHHVEQHQAERPLPDESERLLRAARRRDLPVAVGLEQEFEGVPVVLVVVDNQDGWRSGTHGGAR